MDYLTSVVMHVCTLTTVHIARVTHKVNLGRWGLTPTVCDELYYVVIVLRSAWRRRPPTGATLLAWLSGARVGARVLKKRGVVAFSRYIILSC